MNPLCALWLFLVLKSTSSRLKTTNYELQTKSAHFSALCTQLFEYFQTFHTTFRTFSNIFECFQTFFFLPISPKPHNLTPWTPFLPQKPMLPPKNNLKKPDFSLNHDNFSPNFVNPLRFYPLCCTYKLRDWGVCAKKIMKNLKKSKKLFAVAR